MTNFRLRQVSVYQFLLDLISQSTLVSNVTGYGLLCLQMQEFSVRNQHWMQNIFLQNGYSFVFPAINETKRETNQSYPSERRVEDLNACLCKGYRKCVMVTHTKKIYLQTFILKKYVEKLAEDDNAFIKSIFIKVLPVIVM